MLRAKRLAIHPLCQNHLLPFERGRNFSKREGGGIAVAPRQQDSLPHLIDRLFRNHMSMATVNNSRWAQKCQKW